jgi:hypothetical protein
MLGWTGPQFTPDTGRLSETNGDILLFESSKRRMSPFISHGACSVCRIPRKVGGMSLETIVQALLERPAPS